MRHTRGRPGYEAWGRPGYMRHTWGRPGYMRHTGGGLGMRPGEGLGI